MELITQRLKLLFAEQFYHAATEHANTSLHMVGAKVDTFENGIPEPGAGVYASFYQIHDQMLFGKRIKSEDISYMIRNIQWVAGTKYDMYDDKDNDLYNKNYYVIADQADGSYGVFKCIYKNPLTDPESIYKPLITQTTPSDEIYITGDGYHWKYMFTIDAASYAKFTTSTYAPITVDAATISAAVPGTIDAILTEDPGTEYNNYAYGKIKSLAYGNDTIKLSIVSDDVLQIKTYDLVYTSNTTFSEGDTVTIQVPNEAGVVATIYKTELSSISFEITDDVRGITQSTIATSNTAITVSDGTTTAEVVAIQEENLPTLSNDNNFYVNSTFYIRGGTGAGQIKTVTGYELIGNDRVITVDTPFETELNLTSKFSILPKITIRGDGEGAVALPEINPSANSISDIRMINRGQNYTFADVAISGNTGVLAGDGSAIIADNADLRAIIAPPGGHGSNPREELNGSNIGMSVSFAEGEVLDNITFSKIAVVKNLLQNNIQLTVDSVVDGDYQVGEAITQTNNDATGVISAINTDTNVITLTDVFGEFVTAANTDIAGNTSTSTVTSINRSTNTFNNDLDLEISPIISSFEVGEVVKQNNSNASGIVVQTAPTVINIVEILGSFTTNVSDVLIGQTSGARALITNVEERKTVDNSGEVVYVENVSQISRSADTTEQIKLILKF